MPWMRERKQPVCQRDVSQDSVVLSAVSGSCAETFGLVPDPKQTSEHGAVLAGAVLSTGNATAAKEVGAITMIIMIIITIMMAPTELFLPTL